MSALTVLEYDPFSDEVLDDCLTVYARLRAESPVHFLERHDSWALALFEDVWNAGEDPETFRSPGPTLQTTAPSAVISAEGEGAAATPGSIFGMNPPQHTALRKRLARQFTPMAAERRESWVRAAVREYIAEALPVGRLEAIQGLAVRISVRVACQIIGLPIEDADMLAGVVGRFFMREPGVEGMPPDAMAASIELNAYLVDAVRERRQRGVGEVDVMDDYISISIDDRPYSDEELAQHLITLVVAGTETLPKVFAGGVLQLYRHPDQRAELAADPTLISDAFTEIARYEMPTQFLTRRLTRDVELRGQKLREGQGVLFLYRCANRDEREFEDPDRFDIHRRAPRILSFGHGTHVCLGQHAAKLEARIMYEELLGAVPEYEVVEDEVVLARSEFVAGYLEVPIVFEPRG